MHKDNNKNNNKNEYLPLYGIGPILCFPMVVLTALGIFLSQKEYIPGKIFNGIVNVIFLIIGIFLIIEGIVLFFGADAGGNLKDDIRDNKLKTNGAYKFVRNPCYTLFLLGSTGAILIAHNYLLLILPVLFWLEMTIVLKNTEEKWLKGLYGQEYVEYSKNVNRCIPWFPKKIREK